MRCSRPRSSNWPRLTTPGSRSLAIVGHDDPDTAAVAEAVAARHPDRVRVVVDPNWPKNKPKALGARIRVCCDPYLVTREETPDTVMGLLKQRTRWNQGFLQVLRKREWRQIPSWRQRMLARYTLCQPFLQAFAGIAILIAVASMFVAHLPVGLSLLTFLPMGPTLAMVAFELVGLREFCRVYHVRPRKTDYVRLLIGTGPYQVILAAAACRAVLRELRGHRGWEKTAHNGAHRDVSATGGFSLVRAAS